MKKSLIILPVFIIIILSVVHIIVSNMLSTSGVELDSLQVNLLKYKRENIILREKILDNSSLYKIASSAAELGFVDAKNHVYIPAKLPLAKR